MKGNVKRFFSGMLSVITILTSVIQPLASYAAEPEPAAYEAEYPALEKVRDMLEADEVVKAEDYEMDAGGSFDVQNDFSGLEIHTDKVKVTFHEAKNGDGRYFDNNYADTYKAIYFVEPVSGNPSYHISRNIIVKEPVVKEQSEGDAGGAGEDGQSEVSGEEDGESESHIEALENGESEGMEELPVMPADTETDSGPAAEQELITEAQVSTEPEILTAEETEAGTEIETEIETESETEGDGDYQVKITRGDEFAVSLNHEDGSYDAGETVEFSADMPEGCLTAVGALKVKGNEAGDTADLLYSEVTYHPDTDTFSFEMPSDDIALEVMVDQAEGGIMLLAAGDEGLWDEATEIEANTYYYYSDGTLHPFNSVMGSGGNDSYKYVRYKVNGKTYTVNAYCMQHSQPSPPSGTTYANMVELNEGGDDKYLRKAFFYGYGGPGWGDTFNGYNIKNIMESAGCTSETRAMQHYLVDYLYDGESGFGGALSATAQNMIKEIKTALSKMPDPTAMELLPGLSITAKGTQTETFTWKANEAFTITIHLEKGVSLVNETTGKTSTGNVTVKGGDKFHLVATTNDISSLNGNYAITSNYPLDFHTMLLKLQSSQDIGFGYYTDSSEISLSVDWPEQAQLDIVKQDGSSGTKLAGAVYGVYSDEGCKNLIVQMPPTDKNGASSVVFNVTGSKVYLKELTAPKGYKINVNAVGVSVSAGKTATKTLTDTEVMGSLKIYKEGQALTGAVSGTDGTTFQYEKRRLAGATYKVTAAEDIVAADGRTIFKKGAVVAENVTTGTDGSATVGNLHFGKYTVTETGAPKNYINKGESKTVTISSSSQTVETVLEEVTFSNDRQKAEVTVVKQDKETLSPLAGGIFALYADSDIKNVDGTVIVGKDTLIGKAATGSDGHGKFGADIPVGYSYYVKEFQAPDKFLLNTEDVYHFSFAYTTDKEAVVKFTHTFINEEPRGNITIYKEGEVLTGAAVTENGTTFQYERRKQKGAVYDVYAGADIKTAAGKLIYQKGAVVAENLITGEDGSVTLSDLYLGTYTVKEKAAPKNFVNKGESKNVTLSYNGQTEKVILGNTTFQNDRQKISVTVTKVDNTTKNPLAGGIYGLYAAQDIKNADGAVVVKKDTFIEKVITGADGSAAYQGDLPINYSYYIKELQAPENYLRNTEDVYTFTFGYTHDTEATVSFAHTFENERVNAKINLVKVDKETGKPQGDAVLEKAVYGLYAREDITHPDKKTGVIYKAGTQIATLTTDAKGTAFVENLYLGKYYVKEITPSNGYLLDEKEYDLSCDYEGDLVATVERTATSGEQVIKQPFQIIKIANNGKTDADLLAGAGFTAYLESTLKVKEEGTYDFASASPVVIGENGATEIFTDNKGYAVSIAIPFGSYIVRETTTPHNYKPVNDFAVRISENHPNTPQVWRVLLDDEFTAKLKIVKQDDETKKPVLAKNTEFKIYDLDDGKYVEQVTTYPTTVVHKSYFTDGLGYLVLPQNLKIGHYRIEEVNAPYGYTLNENYYEVAVDSNTAYQIDSISGDVVIELIYENHPVRGLRKISRIIAPVVIFGIAGKKRVPRRSVIIFSRKKILPEMAGAAAAVHMAGIPPVSGIAC